METWQDDSDFDEHPLDEVKRESNGYVLVRDGWHLGIEYPGFEPKAGQMARYFPAGIGRPVRGVVIDGRVAYYRTKAEEDKRHDEWVAAQRRQREREFEENRAARDAQFDALPPDFQARIQRFRDGNPDFRIEHEPYEMFCCEQAVVIAKALKTLDAVRDFAKLDWKEQKRLVPAIDDGHSGNTFSMAVRLAGWYLSKPENVVKEHGALTPLVGCKDYGCTHESDDVGEVTR